MIDDGIKDESADVVRYFNKLGINTYMFTGDRREMSLFIGKRVGIKTIKSEMLPTDKFLEYEKMSKKTGMTIFL